VSATPEQKTATAEVYGLMFQLNAKVQALRNMGVTIPMHMFRGDQPKQALVNTTGATIDEPVNPYS
jgi:hypothetical protein